MLQGRLKPYIPAMNKKFPKLGKQEVAGQEEDQFLAIDRKTKGERGCWGPDVKSKFLLLSK